MSEPVDLSDEGLLDAALGYLIAHEKGADEHDLHALLSRVRDDERERCIATVRKQPQDRVGFIDAHTTVRALRKDGKG